MKIISQELGNLHQFPHLFCEQCASCPWSLLQFHCWRQMLLSVPLVQALGLMPLAVLRACMSKLVDQEEQGIVSPPSNIMIYWAYYYIQPAFIWVSCPVPSFPCTSCEDHFSWQLNSQNIVGIAKNVPHPPVLNSWAFLDFNCLHKEPTFTGGKGPQLKNTSPFALLVCNGDTKSIQVTRVWSKLWPSLCYYMWQVVKSHFIYLAVCCSVWRKWQVISCLGPSCSDYQFS